MDNKVIDLLLKIKERPGAYLGTNSLSNLRLFMEGYIYALDSETELKNVGYIYYKFNEWLNKKYNITDSIFWEKSLTNVSDSDAFDMFYEELSAYLETTDVD